MRRFVPALAAAMLATAHAAHSQAVTLPTVRSTKTPEVTALNHSIRDVLNDGAKLRIITSNQLTTQGLQCDMALMAISPYSQEEWRDANQPSASSSVTSSTYRTMTGRTFHNASAPAIAAELAKIVSMAPDSCRPKAVPSESDVTLTMTKYLDAEDNLQLHAELDTLMLTAFANVIQRELRKRHFFPVQSHDQAMLFWKQPAASAMNVGAISGSTTNGAAFTELTSRFLQVIRISVNTVLSAAKDSATGSTTPSSSVSGNARLAITPSASAPDTGASQTTISRFLNGGGLLNVAGSVPWFHAGLTNGAADLIAVLAPRVGGTLPVLGAMARDTSLMYDLGQELFFRSADYVDGIGVFGQTRMGFAGGTPKFMQLLGDASHHHTMYETVSFGLSLDDKYLITLSRTVSGPHSLQNGWQIGATLSRTAVAPTVSAP